MRAILLPPLACALACAAVQGQHAKPVIASITTDPDDDLSPRAKTTKEVDVSGCYRVEGSGRNGFGPLIPATKGHAYLQQQRGGVAGMAPTAVTGCIQQRCFTALDGDLTVTENGVGMVRLARSDDRISNNCTAGPHATTMGRAFFLFMFPAGWAGEPTTGSFVNNWAGGARVGQAGWFSLNKTTDVECRLMAHRGCVGPPPTGAVVG